MQHAVRRAFGVDATVVPFLEPTQPTTAAASAGDTPRFFYPASGEPHKNHAALLNAWRLLAESGHDAQLHLTIADGSPVASLIAAAQRDGIAVVNHGVVAAATMRDLYASSAALIFPSSFESFGLPLLEAAAAGLAVVAAERDYVRDVVVPTETFDPESPVSIARAVRRLLGAPEAPVAPLTPAAFITGLLASRTD